MISFLFPLFLFLLLPPYATTSATSTCPSPPPTPPFILPLIYNDTAPTLHCHALLLSDRWLITPPHCHDPSLDVSLSLPEPFAPIPILRWLIPQSLDDFPHNDHPALIHLETKIPTPLPTVRVNSDPHYPPPAHSIRIFSFLTPTYSESPPLYENPPTIVSTAATTLDRKICPTHFPALCNVSANHLCVEHPPSTQSTCAMCALSNDQSLIATDDQGNAVLLAVGMTQRGKCNGNFIARFMRIAPYIEWMRSLEADFETAGGVEAYGGSVEFPSPSPKPSVANGPLENNSTTAGDIGGLRSSAVAIGVPIALVALAAVLAAVLGGVVLRRRK